MFEEKEDGLVMEAMARPLGSKMTEKRVPEERQVTDEVQDFMADEFVSEAKLAADDPLFIQDNGVVQASPQGQAALSQFGRVLEEPERPGGGDLLAEKLSGQGDGHILPADERMGEIDGVGYPEIRVRREGEAGSLLFERVRLENPDGLNGLGDRPQARLQNVLNPRGRAPIQYGDFLPKELDLNADEPEDMKHRKEMLEGLDAAGVEEEAGAIQALHLPGIDLHFPAAQVHPPEEDFSLRGGLKGQADLLSRMNPDAREGDGPPDRPFLNHLKQYT